MYVPCSPQLALPSARHSSQQAASLLYVDPDILQSACLAPQCGFGVQLLGLLYSWILEPQDSDTMKGCPVHPARGALGVQSGCAGPEVKEGALFPSSNTYIRQGIGSFRHGLKARSSNVSVWRGTAFRSPSSRA